MTLKISREQGKKPQDTHKGSEMKMAPSFPKQQHWDLEDNEWSNAWKTLNEKVNF